MLLHTVISWILAVKEVRLILNDRSDDSRTSLGRMMSDHREFASLVMYEVKRSERYCSFVSLLSIALERLDERLQRKYPADAANADVFIAHLLAAIRSTVRATDIVSRIDKGRLGLLLVETPRDGAVALARRLREHLYQFFDQTGDITSAIKIEIKIGSFPGDSGSIEKLLRDFSS